MRPRSSSSPPTSSAASRTVRRWRRSPTPGAPCSSWRSPIRSASAWSRLAFAAPLFHDSVVRCPLPPEEINRRLLSHQILGGLPLGRFYPDLRDCWLVCVTETRTREEIDRLIGCLEALQ